LASSAGSRTDKLRGILLPDGIRIDPFLLSAPGFAQIASEKIVNE